MSFSTDAWNANQALYDTILAMPFNRELAAGTLSNERFRHYIVQDAHYLKAYARVYAMASARADTEDLMVTMADWAAGTMRAERSLHERYFQEFGLSAGEVAAIEPTPTCLAYTGFLTECGTVAPLEVTIAAMLPCQWVYWEVGQAIAAQAAPDNPFAAWIATYSAQGFGEACDQGRAETDRLAAAATPAVRERMHHAFRTAMRLEYLFWDSSWRLETWPAG